MSASDATGSNAACFPPGGLAIVVGASGGIGGALLAHLRSDALYVETVGLSRSGTPAVDLTDESSIANAAARIARGGHDLRLLIDATGILHGEGCEAEKTWRRLAPAAMARSFAVNAIGPMLLMKHFLPLLARSGKSVFATLSARVGSIGDNRLGGWYSYRASKAALNQFVRTAAIELRRSHPEAVCVALHPGTVDTRLTAPFAKTGLEVRPPPEAARQLLSVIDALTAGDSGSFIDYRGGRLPW